MSEEILFQPGVELRVTGGLPFEAHDADGNSLGMQHWFPMFGYVWVSQELWDKLKVGLPHDR